MATRAKRWAAKPGMKLKIEESFENVASKEELLMLDHSLEKFTVQEIKNFKDLLMRIAPSGPMSEQGNNKLPVPRLELQFEKRDESWNNQECWYYLVYRHFSGYLTRVSLVHVEIHGDNNESPIHNGKIKLPSRHELQIKNYAKQMNLPAYALCENIVNIICTSDE